VNVQDWALAGGNAPSKDVPTLRAALDRASTQHPIAVLGDDGHHSAYNSAALGRARNKAGQVVGLSRATLVSDFADYRFLIDVDENGEPSGGITEYARDVIGAPSMEAVNLAALMKAPEKVPQRLNSVGITAMQDAAVWPEMLRFYDTLVSRGRLTVRTNLLQMFMPEEFRRPDGRIDYDRLLAAASAVRSKYAGSELLRADTLKIFADGGLEGNPRAIPPTLPNSPSIRPYLQPIFGTLKDGKFGVSGYVDTGSALCKRVRAMPAAYSAAAPVADFIKANGYHPGQCGISSGKFRHDRQVILDYVRRAHLAGFAVHIHVVGDEATRTAIDAIEQARIADGNSFTSDTLAHVQQATAQDVARIGKDRLFLASTYSWMNALPDYDMLVIPFLERVSGSDLAAFHDVSHRYGRQFYPVRSTQQAGGILLSGSDAPVEARDPRPFLNIQVGITRRRSGYPVANASESVGIRDLIDAYTINGARAMGRAKEFGSIEVGKSADFIVLSQDVLALADAGKPEQISTTKVLETRFRGQRVYAAARAR